MYGRYFFSADEVRAADLDVARLLGQPERGRFAGLDFELDGDRVSAGIKVDVEDERGCTERHSADWHDTQDVKRATLMGLIAHGRIRALAGQLSTVRSDEGISQAALAAALGLPKESGNVQISRWESVHRTPSLATLIQMGEMLDMELVWVKKVTSRSMQRISRDQETTRSPVDSRLLREMLPTIPRWECHASGPAFAWCADDTDPNGLEGLAGRTAIVPEAPDTKMRWVSVAGEDEHEVETIASLVWDADQYGTIVAVIPTPDGYEVWSCWT